MAAAMILSSSPLPTGLLVRKSKELAMEQRKKGEACPLKRRRKRKLCNSFNLNREYSCSVSQNEVTLSKLALINKYAMHSYAHMKPNTHTSAMLLYMQLKILSCIQLKVSIETETDWLIFNNNSH